jgi:hypothetical protein
MSSYSFHYNPSSAVIRTLDAISIMPVTTRRQAQQAQQTREDSTVTLDHLPAEIIQEIMYHLDPHTQDAESVDSEFSDVDYDRMSVTSMGYGSPERKVMPCCRIKDGDVGAGESRIPIMDSRSTFSATSRRMRDIVSSERHTRRRTIRYCKQWIEETRQLSGAIRSRYM